MRTAGANVRLEAPNGRGCASEYDDEQLADVLSRAMTATGHGPTTIGRALNIPRQHVQQMRRGARPLRLRHLDRLPEETRDYMLRELLGRWGRALANRLPPTAAGLRSALAELAGAGADAARLLSDLWDEKRLTAEGATHVRSIGEKAIRAGASLVEWAEQVERERVVSIEEEP